MALLYDGKTYGREIGRMSPEGNLYGQRALVRDLTRYFWWDGHEYIEFPEIVDQASSSQFLPPGPRPFGEMWRVLRHIPKEDKKVWDYYFWDSETERWKPIRWLWSVDSLGKLPRPGLFVGAAHRFTEGEIEIIWDGFQWKRLFSHRGLADDEPERHLPPGLIELFVPDVKLSYRSATELALDPVPGGKGYVMVNGEKVEAELSCSVFNTLPVLMWDDVADRVFSIGIEANKEYFVYLANRISPEFKTDQWDFRGKLFLSKTAPASGYLAGIGTGKNARIAGKIQTNAFKRFIRELDISLISRGPSLTETFREYSDFRVIFVDQNTVKLEKKENAYGQIYIPEELQYIGEGQTVTRFDKSVVVGVWVWIADGLANNSEIDSTSTASAGSMVTASSHTINYEPWKAFNDEYGLMNRWLTSAGNTTGWICYDFGENNEKVINKYRWRSMESDSDAVPGAWQLQGSNDYRNWTILHSGSNNTQTANTWVGWFTFINDSAYRYYRMFVTANCGHPSYLVIDEIELVQAIGYTDLSSGKLNLVDGPFSPSATYYLYIANMVDGFNFNAINPETNRPWQMDDENAAGNYLESLDLRLRMFASNNPPDHGRLTESEPGFWTRYLGKVETDAYGRFKYSRNISAVNPLNLDPVDFEGLAEIQIVPVDSSSFKIAAIRGTSGVIFVGGDTVRARDVDASNVHTVRTTDTVYVYNQASVDSPLIAQQKVNFYGNTKFYVYMANSREVWGSLASEVFVCNVPPSSNGYLSQHWPGNQARWLLTLTTSPEGLFTGDYAVESVAPLFARISDGNTSLNTTWSSQKTDYTIDNRVQTSANTLFTIINSKINDLEVTTDKTWSSYKIGAAISTAVGASLGPSTVAAGLPFRLEYNNASSIKIVYMDQEERPIYFPDEQMIRFYPGDVFYGTLPAGTGIRYVGLSPSKQVVFDSNFPGKSNLGIFSIGSAYYIGLVGMTGNGSVSGLWNVDSYYYGLDWDFQTGIAQDSVSLTLPSLVAAREKTVLMSVAGAYTGQLSGSLIYRSLNKVPDYVAGVLVGESYKYCNAYGNQQDFSYIGVAPQRIMTANYFIDFSVSHTYPSSISPGLSDPSFSIVVSKNAGWLVDHPCDCYWCEQYGSVVNSRTGITIHSPSSSIKGYISIRNI